MYVNVRAGLGAIAPIAGYGGGRRRAVLAVPRIPHVVRRRPGSRGLGLMVNVGHGRMVDVIPARGLRGLGDSGSICPAGWGMSADGLNCIPPGGDSGSSGNPGSVGAPPSAPPGGGGGGGGGSTGAGCTNVDVGAGNLVCVPPDVAAAYWAGQPLPPQYAPAAPAVPMGLRTALPPPPGAPAPGGSAPAYTPFSPAPWPPMDTDQIAALGIPCLPPDWPGAGSGYYTTGSQPVPAACSSWTAQALINATGHDPSTYGVTPCSPGGQQLCVAGKLPAVVTGGPGGGISFAPGGGILQGGPQLQGSGPGGIYTPADMTAGGGGGGGGSQVVPMIPGPGGTYIPAPRGAAPGAPAPSGGGADALSTIQAFLAGLQAKGTQTEAVATQASGITDFLSQSFSLFGVQIPYWAAGLGVLGAGWLMKK